MARVRLALLALMGSLVLGVSQPAAAADPRLQIVQFTASWCKPCQSMRPAIERLAQEGWRIEPVDADRHPELIKQFQITSLPTLVLVHESKLVERIEGAYGYQKLLQRFEAASQKLSTAASRAGQGIETVRGQSPTSEVAFPPLSIPERDFSSRENPVRDPSVVPDASPSQQAMTRAALATVRIRIEESNSVSFGTGTVIHVHGEQALALTCGHLFREFNPAARMSVDVYSASGCVNVPAQLVDFNAKDCDIGLIEFRAPFPIVPVAIADASQAPQIGHAAFSMGCDKGADPSRRDTRIKKINRYLGPANVEIEGAPVLGRSGGGLFDAQGRLIGVCNAADQEDDEGIYAALPVIHQQVAALNLPAASPTVQLASSNIASPLATTPIAAQPVATATPSSYWPDRPAPIAPSASLASSKISMQCIVRDADGRESLLTIDRVSDELLNLVKQQAKR